MVTPRRTPWPVRPHPIPLDRSQANMKLVDPSPRSSTARWWSASALLCALVGGPGCASAPATQGASPPSSLLVLEVEPREASVYIDGDYQGQVEGWSGGAIPVRAGARRVELRAPGHLTQRFDVDVAAREEVTLRVKLEPELERVAPRPRDDKRERGG